MTDQTTPVDDNGPIAVTLTEAEWKALVEFFISKAFSAESVQTYDEAIAEGKTVVEAVFDAVRNEACNEALEAVMAEVRVALDGGGVMHEDGEFDDSDFVDPYHAPSKMIWVTFQKEGVHLYPAAATDPKLKTGGWDDVSFLGVPHRHIFHFRVSMEVVHSDRDVEFIQFKRWLERLYADGTLELNHKSCEMIAEDLAVVIQQEHPGRTLIIEVSEDGENGATLHFPK